MRPSVERRPAAALAPGDWFDLNSGEDSDPIAARVLSVTAADGHVHVDFVTIHGDDGEAHLRADEPMTLMEAVVEDEEG